MAAEERLGPYADGMPRSTTAADGHVSAARRFYDSGFHVVPWTAEMALRAARVRRDIPRAEQVDFLRDAIDDDRLPEAAVDALIAAGWRELAD